MDVKEPDAKYLVRRKSFRTELGDVPSDWEIVSLLSLADEMKERFDDGDWIEAEHLRPSGIRLIQTGNIGIGAFVDKASKKYISERSFELLRCKRLREGDLLICRLAEPAGRACIFPRLEEDKAITAVDVTIFRPVAERVDRRYLLHVFSTNSWLAAVSERCGGSTRSRIARGALGKISVPVPSITEQSAIADALSDADTLIESLEQLLAKKRQIKQGAMQELLTGQKRLPGFNGEWVTAQLGEVAPLQRGFDLPNRALRPGPYPVIYSNGVLHQHAKYVVKGPGVVTGRSGTIGNVTFVEQDYWPHNTSLWVTEFKGHDPRFVYYLYQHVDLGRFSTGSGVPTLNRNDVHGFSLKLPPSTKEESAIAAILSDMDADISVLEVRLAKARRIKQGMMQALLTGRIRLV